MSLAASTASQALALLLPHLAHPLVPLGAGGPTCPCCGEPFLLDLLEVWSAREFMLDTCCEQVHDLAVEMLSEDGRAGADLLRLLDVEAICGGQLRRVADNDTGQLVLDWQLDIRPVSLATAREFVREHHAHCPNPPPGWRFGAGAFNGPTLVGVVMVGRPVARLIDHTTTVEVSRLCVRRDIPQALAWNGCSILYGWAAREAKRRGFSSVITYTLEDEQGTTLRAAGWKSEGPAGGGSWNSASRARADRAPTTPKVRWRRVLRQQKVRQAPVGENCFVS